MLVSSLGFAVSHAPRCLLLLASWLITTTLCFAQNADEPSKLSVARGEIRKYFGSAISLDRSMETGDRRVLIGAPTRYGADGAGSAHLFRFRGSAWEHEQELTNEVSWVLRPGPHPPEAHGIAVSVTIGPLRAEWTCGDRHVPATPAITTAFDNSFGEAVSLYGDTALVSSSKTRVVYVFEFDGTEWIQDAVLNPDGARGIRWSVSLWKDCALIGTLGKVYVFRRTGNGWTKGAELGVSGFRKLHFGTSFGTSVSLYERTAIIGNSEGTDFFPGKGRAYVFRYDGSQWIQEAVLKAPDGHRGARFGGSVSLSRDVCVIGAERHWSEGYGSGAAYIFRRDGKHWAHEQKLRPKLGSPGENIGNFGDSTSIDGDNAIVGVPYYGSQNRGSAFVYEWNGDRWMEVSRNAANDLAPRDFFGSAVSIGRGYAAAGAPNQGCNGACYGAVYLWRL